jgi:hypothetical protein
MYLYTWKTKLYTAYLKIEKRETENIEEKNCNCHPANNTDITSVVEEVVSKTGRREIKGYTNTSGGSEKAQLSPLRSS